MHEAVQRRIVQARDARAQPPVEMRDQLVGERIAIPHHVDEPRVHNRAQDLERGATRVLVVGQQACRRRHGHNGEVGDRCGRVAWDEEKSCTSSCEV